MRYLGPFALVLLLAILLRDLPSSLAEPYPTSYHGTLTAWFALMAENMHESGFAETRMLPTINPNRASFPDFRYYITHPVGDVVLRALAVRWLGPEEWVLRLQGFIGCVGAALMLFLLARPRLGTIAAVLASYAMAAQPIFSPLARLSMHHPMTLFAGLLALWLADRYRSQPGRLRLGLLVVVVLFGCWLDWPGYFVPGLIWLGELLGKRRKALFRALELSVIASLAAFYIHVSWIGGQDLFAALRAASDDPLGELSRTEAFRAVFRHQVAAYGWSGIVLALSVPLLALLPAVANLKGLDRTRGGLWLLLFAWGAANILAFPVKARARTSGAATGFPSPATPSASGCATSMPPRCRRAQSSRRWSSSPPSSCSSDARPPFAPTRRRSRTVRGTNATPR